MQHADPGPSPIASLPAVQRVSAVLWPSFLLAGTATVVFFALIDPLVMLDCHGAPPLSRTGAFLFWLLTAAASACTAYYLGTRIPPRKPIDEPEGA
jgi:hypothetical protein